MTEQVESSRAKARWLTAAEVALAVAIVALLVATWLPAIVGGSATEPSATERSER